MVKVNWDSESLRAEMLFEDIDEMDTMALHLSKVITQKDENGTK